MSEAADFTFLDPGTELTPPEVDRHLKTLINELARAQLALRRARTEEIEKQKEYEAAKYKLLLDEECPVPLTNRSITNTHREEWVNAHIPELWWAFVEARNTRQAEWDYLTRLDTQGRLLQSINKNAGQALDLAWRHA